MSFLVQAFLERSPRAAIEVPCYDRMVTLLQRNGAEISTVSRLSGGVDLDSAPLLAGAGADLISVGAITHSAPALDLGFDLATGTGRRG